MLAEWPIPRISDWKEGWGGWRDGCGPVQGARCKALLLNHRVGHGAPSWLLTHPPPLPRNPLPPGPPASNDDTQNHARRPPRLVDDRVREHREATGVPLRILLAARRFSGFLFPPVCLFPLAFPTPSRLLCLTNRSADGCRLASPHSQQSAALSCAPSHSLAL